MKAIEKLRNELNANTEQSEEIRRKIYDMQRDIKFPCYVVYDHYGSQVIAKLYSKHKALIVREDELNLHDWSAGGYLIVEPYKKLTYGEGKKTSPKKFKEAYNAALKNLKP